MEVKRYEGYGINNDNDDNNIQKSENLDILSTLITTSLFFVLCSLFYVLFNKLQGFKPKT